MKLFDNDTTTFIILEAQNARNIIKEIEAQGVTTDNFVIVASCKEYVKDCEKALAERGIKNIKQEEAHLNSPYRPLSVMEVNASAFKIDPEQALAFMASW